MKYTIPKQLPSRSDFLTQFFDAIIIHLILDPCVRQILISERFKLAPEKEWKTFALYGKLSASVYRLS